MQKKWLGIGGFGIILLIAGNIFINFQQSLTPMPIAPWERLIVDLFGTAAIAATILAFPLAANMVQVACQWFQQRGHALIDGVRTHKRLVFGFLAAILLLSLAGNILTRNILIQEVLLPTVNLIWHPTPTSTPSPNPFCPTAQVQSTNLYLSVKQQGVDCIGLSTGNTLFDTQQRSQKFIADAQRAVEATRANPFSSQAQAAWDTTIGDDLTDAEPRIYREDIQVQEDAHPHVTLIVAAILTGVYYHDGRDVLQGAYLEQREHNDACRQQNYANCILLNVIVANIGSGVRDESDYAAQVADQMILAVKHDATIIGVVSGVNSQGTININTELNQSAQKLSPPLPVVASKATYDALAGVAHLFSVVPLDSNQARVSADYISTILHATSIAVLFREGDTYSQDLARDFKDDTPSAHLAAMESYIPRNSSSVQHTLQDVLNSKPQPQVLYCACYANEVNTILQWLAKHPTYNNLLIIGGDALYELGDYTSDTQLQMDRLRFTSFTYPDLWSILHPRGVDLPAALDPNNPDSYNNVYGKGAGDGRYGSTRMTPSTSTAYDATLVFTTACDQTFSSQSTVTSPAVENAITSENIIGITGRITFGSTNVQSNKIIVVIQAVIDIDSNGKHLYFQYANFSEGIFV